MFENGIQGSQYCASDPSGRNDSCHGDSGGPLQFFPNHSKTAYIVGIISSGTGCGTLPTIRTRIAYYIDWIVSHVWSDGFRAIDYDY